MDSTKPSLSSKALHLTSGGGNESSMEEGSVLWRDSVEGERQTDGDSRETDVADGTTAAAEINHHHKGSADKHKFNTLGYQRRTKQKVVTDFSTLSKGTSAAAKPRAALRQVLFSQGVSDKNPASEERGQLDVLKHALQTFRVPVSLKWKWKEESEGTTLEKNWTDIVQSHSTMSKMQKHQQEALWEFVHTELTYINKLIIIKDLVIAALVILHQHGFLLEVTPELLFSNLPSILSAHQLFWQEVTYPMLQEVRRTGKPFDPIRLEAGCLQFHERFPSYKHYCWEEENNLEFTRWQMESNPHFSTYVQWVETHPQCERMRLGDMQAKPHQRITKYPLLLKAVLKTTQDPHVQHILRGMLSSVNSFLESINDYLKLKDEELALSISAQRVEGYEVEGINEEIDKHVREICQFDLTCPIRGVGPGFVRKLLLEENLKIRDRKDGKLEVVALLFSDVLLMTKGQKKGERLKVVRPPLALDKTSCIALKDGCSFVLVEVGELQSAMNVYIFAASTSERCSTWVSTIHQAKETLTKLRKTESSRKQENWKIQLEAKSIEEAKMEDMEMEEQPLTQSGEENFVNQLTEEPIITQSMNGMLASKEAEGHYQPADNVAIDNTGFLFSQSQPSNSNRKSVHKSFAGWQQAVKGYEWIEMGVRRDEDGNHTEEVEKIVESQMTKERKVTFNHKAQSAPNLDLFIHSTAADPLRYNTTGPHSLLLGELPDVDYPTNKDSTLQLPYQPAMSREGPEFQRLPGEKGISIRRDSQSMNHNIRRNSSYSQSGDTATSPEIWGFSKDLTSPGLRRRRPVSIHQGSSTQTSKQFFQGSGETLAGSINSDSDYSLNIKRNSLPSGQSSDSHRVLKLGSLKPNQGMFWSMNDRVSPDPQTLSEPELPDLNFHRKRPSVKTQRSASIPNIIIEGEHGLHLQRSSLYTLPQEQYTPFPISGCYPNRHPSPLEGLLERAKVRVREHGLKREQNLKRHNLRSRYPSPSPSFSTTPSPLPSDGDRDTDWEEEVKLMRHRALTVSKGWKEQLVDGDEDDNRSSVVFTEGVNVDWPGWCFDDDEVLNHLHPGNERLLNSISRSLALSDVHEFSEQEDGECSQV
ncbi:uncharacterized protein plekhg6 [Seriola aureovittata]|uniref:uncharacterized protein plekhg6 n=1 Tax=Seriola aureovittata TaxID=2871759 RepID=UPI0024BEF61E|nr:uncharacterized protein plekhg6 [Seriola aureovittata]